MLMSLASGSKINFSEDDMWTLQREGAGDS